MGEYSQDGWSDFVRDHSLAETDILIFSLGANPDIFVMILENNNVEKVYHWYEEANLKTKCDSCQ